MRRAHHDPSAFPLLFIDDRDGWSGPAFAFEPLQKSFDSTPQEASSELSVEEVNFSFDELRQAESLTVTPAAPGEKGRAPKGYSLLDVGF